MPSPSSDGIKCAVESDHLIHYKDRWADKAKERVNVKYHERDVPHL
jgi:hypothetical protein